MHQTLCEGIADIYTDTAVTSKIFFGSHAFPVVDIKETERERMAEMFPACSRAPGIAVCQYVWNSQYQQYGILWKTLNICLSVCLSIRKLQVTTTKTSFRYMFSGTMSINSDRLFGWLLKNEYDTKVTRWRLTQVWPLPCLPWPGSVGLFPRWHNCTSLQECCPSGVTPEAAVLHGLPWPLDEGCSAASFTISLDACWIQKFLWKLALSRAEFVRFYWPCAWHSTFKYSF